MRWQQAMSSTSNDDEVPAIRIDIPQRYYLLPGAAVLTGVTIGLFRGSRAASLRFLAENAHRTPRTVRGWYLYNKTKNYRVLLGGLKEAGAHAARLGLTAAGWVAIEEGCSRVGLDEVREMAAGLGTGTLFGAVCEWAYAQRAGVWNVRYADGFSNVDRLPWTAFRRTVFLWVMIGGTLRALRWSKEYLQERVQERAQAQVDAAMDGAHGAAGEGRAGAEGQAVIVQTKKGSP